MEKKQNFKTSHTNHSKQYKEHIYRYSVKKHNNSNHYKKHNNIDNKKFKKDFLANKGQNSSLLFLGGVITFFVLANTAMNFYLITKNSQKLTPNINMNYKIIREIQNNEKKINENISLIEKEIKILAENQKKISSILFDLKKELNNKMDTMIIYEKSQGKVLQVLSELIMNDNVKLSKILDKMLDYISSTRKKMKKTETIAKIKEPIMVKQQQPVKLETKEEVKEEIKKETDDLINKYKKLLEELE